MLGSKAWAVALVSVLGVAAGCSANDAGTGAASTVAPTASTVAASTAPASTAPATTVAAVTTAPATTAPAATVAAAMAYARPGPFAVGVTTLQLADRPVTVWYPAVAGSEAGVAKATYDLREYLPASEQPKVVALDAAVYTMDAYAGLPAAPGPFPVALFSHGFAGFRHQSTFLTTALASWGFVVAAPEHVSRDLTAVLEGRLAGGQSDVDDLKQTLLLLAAESARADSPLAGRVDMTKVGAVGHSAGGGAAFQLAGDTTTNVGTVVGLAPAIAADQPVATLGKSSLTIAGSADAIIPLDRVSPAWEALAGPKRLVTMDNVTHLGFMDACAQGNVLAMAQQAAVNVPDLIVRLFADGCDPKYTTAQDAWPAINHLTIAQLRNGLGLDPDPVGLDDTVSGAYAALKVTYRQA